MSEKRTDVDVIRAALETALRNLNVAMPGKIRSYDAETQKAEVIPQLRRAVPRGDGEYDLEDLPPLPNVPVAFPEGGSFFMSFPLQPGDPVILIFSQRSIAAWLASGDAVDPGELKMHGINGAVAYPGLHPDARKLTSASDANMILGRDGVSGAQIEITPAEVHLGAGATKGVARNGDACKISSPGLLLTWMGLVEGFINGIAPGTITTLAATFASAPGILVNAGSSKIKAVD